MKGPISRYLPGSEYQIERTGLRMVKQEARPSYSPYPTLLSQ